MEYIEKVLWHVLRNSQICDGCASELRRVIRDNFPHHQDSCACHACMRKRKQDNPDNGADNGNE